MIKLCFKILTVFWLLSPVAYIIGRSIGIWNTKYDWLITLALTLMSTAVAFMAYEPNKNSGR